MKFIKNLLYLLNFTNYLYQLAKFQYLLYNKKYINKEIYIYIT